MRKGAEIAMSPQNREELEKIENEIIDIQETTIKLIKDKQQGNIVEDVYNGEIEKHSNRMKQLEERQSELKASALRYTEVNMWINAFEKAMTENDDETKSDTVLMKILVDRIIVNENDIEVKFKCGASIKQEYIK